MSRLTPRVKDESLLLMITSLSKENNAQEAKGLTHLRGRESEWKGRGLGEAGTGGGRDWGDRDWGDRVRRPRCHKQAAALAASCWTLTPGTSLGIPGAAPPQSLSGRFSQELVLHALQFLGYLGVTGRKGNKNGERGKGGRGERKCRPSTLPGLVFLNFLGAGP